MNRLVSIVAVLVAAWYAGCSNGAAGGPDGGDAAFAPDGPGGAWMPLPVVAACDAPTTSPGALLTGGTDNGVRAVRIAWGGAEAAVVFVRGSFMGDWTLSLQRLTVAGAAVGMPVMIANGSAPPAAIALAASGSRYLVAWETNGSIGTASVPVTTGAASMGWSKKGLEPAMAFGGGGFVLAYRDGSKVVLQPLSADAQAAGTSTMLETGLTPRIVATDSGYAIAAPATQGSEWRMRRVGFDLATAGGAIAVPGSVAVRLLALGASGERLVAAYEDPDHSTEIVASVIDAQGAASAPAPVNGASQLLFGVVSAAGGKDSFAVTWSDGSAFAGYHAVGADGKPIGSLEQVVTTEWDDNEQDLAAVADGFLIASAVGTNSDRLQVVHLGCP